MARDYLEKDYRGKMDVSELFAFISDLTIMELLALTKELKMEWENEK